MKHSLSTINFFNSYFELLKHEDIAHVILHTYEQYPERLHSDVDYCVSDQNLRRVIPLLYAHCVNSGWKLVQIMQHEVKAFFCVCVSSQNPNNYIQLDVCSHYMREGKVLIKADDLLRNRRKLKHKSFYIPAVGVEFCYSLWKSVAKRKLIGEMFNSLGDLYNADPTQCREIMETLQMTCSEDSFRSWDQDGKKIHQKLANRYHKQSINYRRDQIKKWITRVRQPTGLYLILPQNSPGINTKSVASQLSALFRSTLVESETKLSPRVYKEILRSTLVIRLQGDRRCGILTVLASTQQAVLQIGIIDEGRAIETVLDYLETRLVKRYGIRALC